MRLPFRLSLRMPFGVRVRLLGTRIMDAGMLTSVTSFIESTREVVYLRDVDKILIIRPNKLQHLNDTAYTMLHALYHEGTSPEEMLRTVSHHYNVAETVLQHDLMKLITTIDAVMKDEYGRAERIEMIPFDPDSIKFPILSEIALTYRCQNRCDFCYASSPYRGDISKEMTTDEVKTVIRKIKEEAHVPTISFTGGEPTLRRDLPELIAFARGTGMRVNLITNGIRCGDAIYARELADAGLNSAQVSLESHDETIHDSIVGNSGAFQKTVQAVHNLKGAGVYTHTNSTICSKNSGALIPLVQFVKDTWNNPYLSMNMIIRTGSARDNDNKDITYSSIGSILTPVLDYCATIGIRFVWYSPTPYCIFNPVDHNLGSKSCACVSGLVSVNPSGDILPCSSYNRGVGNLLKHSFSYIWNSDQALYYRERRYKPPVCRGCTYEVLCGGGCPLYWEHRGSFHEIEKVRNSRPRMKNLLWNIEHVLRVRSSGISGISESGGSNG